MVERMVRMCVLVAVLTTCVVFAGKESPARTALEKKDYAQVIQLLEGRKLSSAEDYYLLGKAHKELGQNQDAVKAWTECLLINKELSKRTQWAFLFPPSKSLSASQKKKLKNDFEDEFKNLKAVAKRQGKVAARDKRNTGARSQIEADRLNKKADAKSEAIRDKQHVADRRAMTNQPGMNTNTRRSSRGSCGGIGAIVFLVIIAVIVVGAIFSRRSRGDDYVEEPMHGADTDDLDREILHDIDEREDMRNEAADPASRRAVQTTSRS